MNLRHGVVCCISALLVAFLLYFPREGDLALAGFSLAALLCSVCGWSAVQLNPVWRRSSVSAALVLLTLICGFASYYSEFAGGQNNIYCNPYDFLFDFSIVLSLGAAVFFMLGVASVCRNAGLIRTVAYAFMALFISVSGGVVIYAVLIYMQRGTEQLFFMHYVFLIPFIVAIALLLMIAVWLFGGRRYFSAVMAAACVLSLLAYVALFFAGERYAVAVLRANPPVAVSENDLLAEEMLTKIKIAEEKAKNDPAMPYAGTYRWIERDCYNQIATEDDRKRVMELDSSSGMVEYYRLVDQYLALGAHRLAPVAPGSNAKKLNSIFKMMRMLVGRAALRYEAGDKFGTFEYLKKALSINNIFLDDGSTMTSFIRLAIDRVGITFFFKLAPDEKEFADEYRKLLKDMYVPRYGADTVEEALQRMSSIAADEMGFNSIFFLPKGKVSHFVMKPLLKWAELSTYIAGCEDAAFGRKLRETCLHGKGEKLSLSEKERFWRTITFIRNEGLTRTILALKIYRAEKGEYPETLEQLVPEILENLPSEPLSGEPFKYQRMANGVVELKIGSYVIEGINSCPDY